MTRAEVAVLRVLVVTRDSSVLRPLWSAGESNCWQLEIAGTIWQAMDKVQSDGAPDLLLLDLAPGDADGFQMLRWVRRLFPALPVILIGGLKNGDRREEAIRLGARDYLVKPVESRLLDASIQRNLSLKNSYIEPEVASDDIEPVGNGAFFIGTSPIMQKLRSQLALLSEADMPVLIVGETGSGKETTARLIHKLSIRSGFEFARVNCAALPEDLLEQELFGVGHNGSRASAQGKRGKLEICAKGTIFLDEITEMPLPLQGKLLQVLQRRGFNGCGSDSIEVGTRIVAAGSAKIRQAVAECRFRADLYQFLGNYEIHVPPLRERKEEIPLLARHFMHQIARRYSLPSRDFSSVIFAAWQRYDWPGNLRELETAVKRYLVLGDKDVGWAKADIELVLDSQNGASMGPSGTKQFTSSMDPRRMEAVGSKSLRSLVQSAKSEAEKNAIALALEKTGWNRKAAARLLRVSYRTVLYKIEQYRMSAPDSSPLPVSRSKKMEFYGTSRAPFQEAELSDSAGDRCSEA